MIRNFLNVAVGLVFLGSAWGAESGEPNAEAIAAIAGMRVAPGLKVELWAGDELLANPVAIGVDERGRVLVCETFRAGHGAPDNRGRDWQLLDDLAARTVEDRVAYYEKWQEKVPLSWYTEKADRVRLVWDSDGDGRADHSTIFADGFNDAADGLAAGVMSLGGDVYLTNIPNLWLLRDTDGDGVAEQRRSLSRGYGVRAAFYGHDLHGLVMGPDGKVYFSVGDRGYNVTTPDGRQLVDALDVGRGAVFRCNPDGSGLEVYATGLRNPQDIAFDEYGNLFTVDNNGDNGDKSRVVYIVEGGDSGWSMAFQTMPKDYVLGPFHAEKHWHLRHAGQPAWIIPPLDHLTAGPSGMTFYPGVGLSERYRGHFFIVDFRGAASTTAVQSFAVKPRGAGFEMVDAHEFLGGLLATDVDFGYDGRLYVADFIQGWTGMGRARVYTVSDPDEFTKPIVKETSQLVARLFADKKTVAPVEELTKLLEHPDMRVRLRSQYALANLKAAGELLKVARESKNTFARVHAIWGLGQIGKVEGLAALLGDGDAQVRAQAAKVIGESRHAAAGEKLVALLRDTSPRVRYFAGMALGKIGDKRAVGPLMAMLRENADADVFLRHAGVMGLHGVNDADALVEHASDPSPAVRMGIVLALRRMRSEHLTRFLDDSDPLIVVEAARAIYDQNLKGQLPAVAGLINRLDAWPAGDDPSPAMALHRRVLNAGLRLGGAERAAKVADYASRDDRPKAMRREALAILSDFAEPGPRDRVLGYSRPLPKRESGPIRDVLAERLPGLVGSAQGDLRADAISLALKYSVPLDSGVLMAVVRDDRESTDTRVAAMLAAKSGEAVDAALASSDPALRAKARELVAGLFPSRGVELIGAALADGTLAEQQSALATLAKIDTPEARSLLLRQVERLSIGKAPPGIRLDILEAAESHKSTEVRKAAGDYLGKVADRYALALEGGDAKRGFETAVRHQAAQCIRCHNLIGNATEIGPYLNGIGKRVPREYLLESLVNPSKTIAPGFGTIVVVLKNGQTVAGVLKSEEQGVLKLTGPDGQSVTVNAADIATRTPALSAMPPMAGILTPREMRDVVEYLAGLK